MEILSHMDNNKLRVKHKNLIKKGIVKLSVLKENTKTARERFWESFSLMPRGRLESTSLDRC